MKITIIALLFPSLAALGTHPCAAQDEERVTLRGLKAPPYTVGLDQDLVNPGVYYGNGNANGHWVVATSTASKTGKQLSVALRAHLAYAGNIDPNANKPIEFICDTGLGPVGTKASTRPKWNYDFSINSDVNCPPTSKTCTPLSTYVYELARDLNPTINTTWVKSDPINQLYEDTEMGKFDTVEGTDYPASDVTDYANVINGVKIWMDGRLHVAQNSLSYAFLGPPFVAGLPGSLIDTEGIYDVALSVKERKSGKLVAKAVIRVLVKDDSKCTGRGKCFPNSLFDCSAAKIGKFDMFFSSMQTKACHDFVAGVLK